MAANYTKRNERSAETAAAMQDYARRPPSDPPSYRCEVCGIEKGDGVPIWSISTPISHTLYCTDHIPEEWRPTPAEVDAAKPGKIAKAEIPAKKTDRG